MCLVCFFQAEDGIRDVAVTGVQTCALPISGKRTGTASVSSLFKAIMCSIKAPCEARTPIFMLPTSFSEKLSIRDLLDFQTGHGFSESLGNFRDNSRVFIMRGGFNYCLRPGRRV